MCKRYLVITVLVLAMAQSVSGAEKRVLIDFSHDERIMDPLSAADSLPCFDIFGDTYEIVESDDQITYRNIQDFDMLIICQPRDKFDSTEIEIITRFLNNGGGILLLVAHNPLSGEWASSDLEMVPINSLSSSFGVEFISSNQLWVNTVIQVYGQTHPLLENISRVNSGCYGALVVRNPSKGLLYVEKQKECIAAYCEYGKGRIVYLANSEFILHPYVDNLDNRQFITNVFNWLTEPGGPYQHQKGSLDRGRDLVQKGEEHMNAGDFDTARSTFMQAINYLESALEIYESDTALNLLERANSYITNCGIGEDAEDLYREGESLSEAGDFSAAIAKLEEAQSLFQSINSRRSEDCASLIQECTTKIEGITEQETAEALEEEQERVQEWADELFNEGMTSFDQEEYNAAKTKFEEALGLFTELEDEEKIAECREQIASCDEALETTQISPMMILLLLTVVIVGAVIGAVYLRTRRPVTEKPPGPKPARPARPARPVKPAKPAETDALKMLQARLARGEITKEEYERIKSVIEEE
ncbi:MAG: hypothetical protein AYK18_15545 [Theionarchaea archaeon DG-70]|nr:MAG: hypothetical protein AYK18_15545 [Theionarchaea archaeon DG-70]